MKVGRLDFPKVTATVWFVCNSMLRLENSVFWSPSIKQLKKLLVSSFTRSLTPAATLDLFKKPLRLNKLVFHIC